MKCLSVRQPWAYFLVCGPKDVENRGWAPSARLLREGDTFLIHASAKFDLQGYRWILANRDALGVDIDDIPARDEFALGAIVGAVRFGGVVEQSESPWFFGVKGWVISEARPLVEPIACKGQLGLWDLDEAMSWMAAEERTARRSVPT